MITPNEILQGIQAVQSALNQIEVKGVVNAKALYMSYECLNNICEEVKKTINKIQNETDKESDVDAEFDRDTT